ncbi:nitroreductase [Nocardioides sp. NPDC101246]|uniref:nitroreductase n=1 Tax=Nocardioides sp. NPDC101246 TaxID=3364336 RepID=UPI003809E433
MLEQLLDARHSCRAFTDRAVDDATIQRLVHLAQRSPSWCNTQPWQIHVTRPATTRRLARAFVDHAFAYDPMPDIPFPTEYPGIYGERRRACGWQLYESVGVVRGDRAASSVEALRNYALFGAPHTAIVTTERALGTYGAIDCGVFLGHFLVAATSLGLATVPQAALAAVAPVIRTELGLPDNRTVVFGVSFGYEADGDPVNAFRTQRAAINDVLTFV